MPPQTQRKIVMFISGFQSDAIVSYDGGEERRLSNALEIPRGDGSNNVDIVDDPMIVYSDITVKIAVQRANAFLDDLHALHLQHRDNPEQGSTCVFMSLSPKGDVEKTDTYTQCTIQSITPAQGDTQSHAAAMATVVLRPRGRS
jgi:hypothetical protein